MRVVNSEFLIEIDLAPVKTWQNIQGDVADKVILKTEWQGGDYKIYEWRLGGETGEKISNDYPINKHLTVYAVTNYAKFNLDSTETKIELTSDGKGYTGDKPKGKIIIPDEITEIEGTDYWNRGAFYGCAEITSVQLPQSLTTIGSRAFYDCTGLTSISLPANLTEIGSRAFQDCTGLTSLDLSGCTSLTGIGDFAFWGCTGLTSIRLPASLTEIGRNAFRGCTDLKSLDLSACTSLTEIRAEAFEGCTGLTSVVFADKEGWAVYSDYECKNKIADIQQSDLADTSKAAKYLRESTYNGGYSDKYWKKN